MEGLSLNDLDFSADGFEPFVNDQEEDKSKEDLKTTKEKNLSDEDLDDDKSKDKPQESVAKDKDSDQVQAGKTASKEEGSDSSSPKLNETEQLYSELATQFKAKGVLPGLENVADIKSMDDLNAAIEKEMLSRLDSKTKAIDEAIRAGVSPDLVSEKMDVVTRLKGISEDFLSSDDNAEFRLTAISQDFMSKGYSKERADIMAQRSVDSGTDVEDAKYALKAIIEAEEKSVGDLIKDAKAKETKSITDVREYLDKNDEVIAGIKLNAAQKDEIYSQITTDLGNKENAFMMAQKKDPTGSRIKLETLFYLTKGLTDFSILSAGKTTEVSSKIENLLRGASFNEEGRVNTDSKDTNSSFTLADLKDLQIE
jgi:hypothetical protein